MDMANMSLQEMVDGGTLRSDEYRRMVIPTYNRTLKEFEAPFAASQMERSLDLESSSEVVLPDPFWPEYEQSGDTETFAADYEEFFRAAFALRGARRGPHPQEHEQISDAFYDSLRKKVAADPATAACH
jgi:hypothetical protein